MLTHLPRRGAGNYFARQVDRWTKQYRASETQHIPEFEKLAEWLGISAEGRRDIISRGRHILGDVEAILDVPKRSACRNGATPPAARAY